MQVTDQSIETLRWKIREEINRTRRLIEDAEVFFTVRDANAYPLTQRVPPDPKDDQANKLY